jgi:uncharacterized protein
MRLDTHLHVMLQPFYGRPATDVDALLESLQECGLDGGWASSVDALTSGDLRAQQAANDGLAEMARRYPGRIVGFATVTPYAGEAAAAEVVRCIRELGLAGIKLHPWLQAFSTTHPGLDGILEAAASLGAPVLFHDGTPPYSTPRQIALLASRHPRAQVILGHCGLADYWRGAADAGRLHPSLWLQPSAAPPVAVRAALAAVGPGRMLFGSDGGYGSAAFIRYCVRKCAAAVRQDVFEAMTAANPPRLLEVARQAAG